MKYPLIMILAGMAAQLASGEPKIGNSETSNEYYRLPMQFEPNVGQAAEPVKFLSRGSGYTLLLTPVETVLSLQPQKSRRPGTPLPLGQLRVKLVAANQSAQMQGLEPLQGVVNYFVGNDPEQWHTGIRTFSKVKYHEIYPGIDLLYYGNQRQMEYDFVVGPGGRPEKIVLEFSGEDRLEIDSAGDLIAHLKGGSVRWRKPYAYQETDSGKQTVTAKFLRMKSHRIGFELGTYDRSKPLIIDPLIIYSSYVGGNGSDFASGVAIDAAGSNVVVFGTTTSLNFPASAGAYRTTSAGSNDVYLTKFNRTGSGVVFSTYLGGSGNEYSGGVAMDSSGNIYVAGKTDSANFPTRNAYSSANAGFLDAFIAKFGPFGTNLLYASYLGGAGDDSANAIAADNNGNAFIAGHTYSLGTGNGPFPTVPNTAYQTHNGGGEDAFVAKFNTLASGSSSLVYSTFLGGSTDEKAWAIAVDATGNAYVAGEIQSFNNTYPAPPTSDFPVLNAFEPVFNLGNTNYSAGSEDGFVSKLSADGTTLLFSTYLGGGDDDYATGITVDASGRVYVVGQSASSDFITTTNAVQPQNAGLIYDPDFPGFDAFVTVLQPDGSPSSGSGPSPTNLYYSTLLGGTSDENGFEVYSFGIAVDRLGFIYVAGETQSGDDFPTTVGADKAITNSAASSDIFVAKINPKAPGPNGLVYATVFSGDGDIRGGTGAANYAGGIAVDTNGNFFVAGTTTSTNFPVTAGAYRSTNSGGFYDTVVGKFSSPRDISVSMVPSLEPVIVGSNVTYAIQVNNNGATTFTGVTNIIQLSTNVQLLSASTSAGNVTTNYDSATGWLVTFNLGTLTNYSAVTQSITIKTLVPAFATNTATVTSLEQLAGLEPNTGNNVAPIPNTILGIVDVKINQLSVSANPVGVGSNFTYTIAVGNKGAYVASSILVTDQVPSQLTVNWATNSQGTFCSFDTNGFVTCTLYNVTNGTAANVVINVTAASGGTGTNFAGVLPFDYDSNPANNYSNLVTTVITLSDLAVKQTQSANSIFVTSNLTYTLTITNLGPSAVNNAVITDQLPPGFAFISSSPSQGSVSQNNGLVTCNLGVMASNAIATVSLTVRPASPGTFTNTAVASSEALDLATNNNSASVAIVVNPLADIGLTQTASPSTVIASSNVVFSFTVTNKGPSPATSVMVTDPLPPMFSFVSANSSQGTYSANNGVVTFSLGSLSNNASATASITAVPHLFGVFSNVANVAITEAEVTTNNNAALATVTVIDNPNSPLLKITQVGTNVLLSWSTNILGFVLQTKADLSTNTPWANVTNVPVIVGKEFYVTNSLVSPGKFYRLSKSASVSLMIIKTGPNVVIFWPASFGGTLKTTTNLSNNTAWTLVTNLPALQNGQYFVTNVRSGSSRFFRLFN